MASFKLDGTGTSGTLAFAGQCTIEHAEAMKKALTEALERFEELDLDMSAVEGADLSFLQLVVAAQVEMGKRGRSLSASRGTPPVVADLADQAGMSLGSYEQCFWKKG
ncbi:STAS domain-containing protein [Desulfocurvus sp.]|jgi:anti-anti-sigma regulatory factor|uniref:STAS domain-containing protein n=1 Tax=Desulfocurvus sp. TaxID=2871698 RepID=UPI0025C2B708|nr:STAS domain-containing protein [Desulfocurvus sp.]MCK9240085.1 STAS domain-containing protein [Desulfocurvus sp.]